MDRELRPERRRLRDHPLAPPAAASWALLGVFAVALAPIEGLEWLPRPGSLAWIPATAAIAWLLANAALTAGIALACRRPPMPPDPAAGRDEPSLLRAALGRLRRNPVAAGAAAVVLAIVLLCAGQRIWYGLEGGRASAGEPESFFSLHVDHTRVRKDEGYRGPDKDHWFGTDALGRDIFARVLRGGAVSFQIGLAATLVSLIVGVTWGAAAGYLGGRVDHYLMRIVDVLYGLPFLFLVILILSLVNGLHLTAARAAPVLERAAALEASGDAAGAARLIEEAGIGPAASARAAVFLDRRVDPVLAMLVALGLVQWLTMARIVRGQVLSLREREFVLAARLSGARAPRIIARHIVPNLLGPVIVDATLTIPAVMLSEAFLGFLGLGVGEPECSWGSLAARGFAGVNMVKPYWWLIVYPAGAISIALFCLNFVGDGLRDALDPRSGRAR